MSTAIEKRIAALEVHQNVKEPITIIRIIAMPGHLDAEPDHATVAGKVIQRAEDETGEAFLARVETEAKRTARPGFVGVALVFPRKPSPHAI